MSESIDARLNRIALAEHGVVTLERARQEGIPRSSIAPRVAAGQLVRAHSGVFMVAPLARTQDTQLAAAIRASQHPAAVSHDAAAARHGVWPRWRHQLHVTGPGNPPACANSEVIFHRMELCPSEIMDIDGIATTTIERTCCDLGQTLTKFQIAHVLHEATFRTIISLDELDCIIAGRWHVPGIVAARGGLALHRSGSAGTRSWSEDRFLRTFLPRYGTEPVVNTRGATGVPGIEADFVWPEHGLIVEVDGAGHARPGARESDEQRDQILQDHEWRVLRFQAHDIWSDPHAVCRLVGDALLAVHSTRLPPLRS